MPISKSKTRKSWSCGRQGDSVSLSAFPSGPCKSELALAPLLPWMCSLFPTNQEIGGQVFHRVSSSLFGTVDLSFRAISGRHEFTVQRAIKIFPSWAGHPRAAARVHVGPPQDHHPLVRKHAHLEIPVSLKLVLRSAGHPRADARLHLGPQCGGAMTCPVAHLDVFPVSKKSRDGWAEVGPAVRRASPCRCATSRRTPA